MYISKNIFDAEKFLKEGKPAVIKTETLYGILGDALNPETIEYIYKIKNRNIKKPFIILISSLDDLKNFDITPKDIEKKLLNMKGLTVILEVNNKNLEYLHRGSNSLAFRIPRKENLINLIKKLKTPLVAPSCNPEGKPPAKNIEEAIKYFNKKIPIYIDEGEVLENKPSTIIKVENGILNILREGNYSKDEIISFLKSYNTFKDKD